MEPRDTEGHSQFMKPDQGPLAGACLAGFQKSFGLVTTFYFPFLPSLNQNACNYYAILVPQFFDGNVGADNGF